MFFHWNIMLALWYSWLEQRTLSCCRPFSYFFGSDFLLASNRCNGFWLPFILPNEYYKFGQVFKQLIECYLQFIKWPVSGMSGSIKSVFHMLPVFDCVKYTFNIDKQFKFCKFVFVDDGIKCFIFRWLTACYAIIFKSIDWELGIYVDIWC